MTQRGRKGDAAAAIVVWKATTETLYKKNKTKTKTHKEMCAPTRKQASIRPSDGLSPSTFARTQKTKTTMLDETTAWGPFAYSRQGHCRVFQAGPRRSKVGEPQPVHHPL